MSLRLPLPYKLFNRPLIPQRSWAAYVNGAAVDRNDPKLSEAYVVRMVDLGLPELAFHQAQTLTTLVSNNGLVWVS